MAPSPEVHLRMLTSEDAAWLVEVDQQSGGNLARPFDWEEDKLAAELDEGLWASEDRFGWAIVVDGSPCGFVLVRDLASGDARMNIRLAPTSRGRGIGREVLRQLADHHFSSSGHLQRLVGRTHELNVPMQRAFNAAGFRLEARFGDAYRQPDGRIASAWGYALTRAEWAAGRHRVDDLGYDLHGLEFAVEEVLAGPKGAGKLTFRFVQEGRRATARYAGGDILEGELAGILHRDVLVYRFVHEYDTGDGHKSATGGGRSRLQRRQDGRLEVVNDWSDDVGRHGTTFLVERR